MISVYISLQQEGSFSFHPGWVHLMESEPGIVQHADHLPPPLPADLNGDGQREVIVATRDAKLQVLRLPQVRSTSTDFAGAEVMAEVSLTPKRVRVSAGRRPAAMAVGFLDPPEQARTSLRKQVVVVVTADWTVMCFDHNLRLMWENSLQEEFPHHASIREVAVLVTNHTMQLHDRGLVVVGGSIDLGDLTKEYDPFAQEMEAEEMEARHRLSAQGQERMEQAEGLGHDRNKIDKSRHFNFYSFEGAKGEARWKHESQDFHRDADALAETLIPQHNYRLDASSLNRRHFGEVECRDYRKAVLESLPHRWAQNQDTYLTLAHFAKNRKTKKDGTDKAAHPVDKAAGPSAVAGALQRAASAASTSRGQGKAATKSNTEPNVIVAHLQEGIEVVHLFTGRTVCKLLLPMHGLHADINGDGVVDHVQAHGWHPHGSDTAGASVPRCWATATTGIPVKEQLFNGSICRSGAGGAHDSAHFSRRRGSSEETFSPLEVAVPTLLPRRDAYLAHSPAHAKLRRGAVHDVAFLNSRGEVTVYSADGHKQWQIQAHTSWQRGGYDGNQDVVPSIQVFSPRVGARAEALVVAGATLAHVISPSGKKLQKLDLPDVPLAPVRLVDLNGDGLNDILVTVQGGVFAYLQRSRQGALPFSALLGVLIVAMAVVYFTQQAPGNKNASKSLRSTD
eukprot:CAMPEP_0114256276 /NCGR_PEP_ID=MMETSP0058-20121206/18057_1 /TAXON_ID=36894 /ORGANISM="Pyramimonas parkeae, CCMP726" /LENGTH=677 /DNA_ID=CAMNT_0001370813 /DNA_START=38 /DNA_END=2071 /DNA_ORIENTATION=-